MNEGLALVPVTKKEFGSLPVTDLRDHRHLLRSVIPKIDVKPRKLFRYWNMREGVLDQLGPSCVGFSWTHLLTCGPVKNKVPPPPEQFAAELYQDAQTVDEWPGEQYDGTSVRAGAKVLQASEWIGEYVWEFTSAQRIAYFVLQHGPCIMGTIWADSMMQPVSETGFLKLEGGPMLGEHANGHAYCITGANLKKKCPDKSIGAVQIHQTWGPEWGDKGKAWISLVDLQILLSEGGECCMPVEILKK